MFGFKKKENAVEVQKISKEYDITNINHELIKKYFNNDKKMLYVSFVFYQANTKIHVYSEDKEIIGDIADNDVIEIINIGFNSGIVFLKEQIIDTTGEIEYTTGKVMCTK